MTDLDPTPTVCAKNCGFVYLLRMGGYHKIGRSKNPERRCKELDVWAEPPVLVHTISTSQSAAIEKALQHRFYLSRIRGEWFQLSDADVALICSVSSCNTVDDLPPDLEPPPGFGPCLVHCLLPVRALKGLEIYINSFNPKPSVSCVLATMVVDLLVKKGFLEPKPKSKPTSSLPPASAPPPPP